MARAIMTCGKICSGKSTYSRELSQRLGAAVLSVDELTLALRELFPAERLDDCVAKLQKYLYGKAAELAENGISVILDWGLWTRAERDEAREFFSSRGISLEIHYISVPEDIWQQRIEKRNALVKAGRASAYFVDEGLKAKAEGLFEPPSPEERDIISPRIINT